jgi:calcium-translocating P-type ATPase
MLNMEMTAAPNGALLNRERQGAPRTAAPESRVGLADSGLTDAEAARRLAADGPNELPAPKRERLLSRLLRQLAEPMSLLLLAAAAVSALVLGEQLDAVAITVIVALNAVIGLVQEGRAARALEALRRLETPLARAERAGLVRTIPARELVVGDLVHLAAGDRVPADLELGVASALEVDESLLTGESLPIAKTVGDPGPDGQVWSGTLVTRGAGRGLVTATGTATKLGAVAAGLEGRQDPTPLQRELAALSGRLGLVAVAVAAGVFALILVRTGLSAAGLGRAFLAAVALAVAAVPEGLPTVVTVALALGVRRMAGHGALVRRLPAVETLGAATVLATDKTGTLTENRLRLATVVHAGAGAAPGDGLTGDDAKPLATVAACCNDAQLDPPAGDPVDLALLEAVGADRVARLRAAWTRLAGLPFDAERRRMTVLVSSGAQRLLVVKGAPETVLARCGRQRSGPTVSPLSAADRAGLLEQTAVLAGRGQRVLALAWRPLVPRTPAGADLEELEGDLELLGLVGLADPLRPTAPGAVAEAQAAGIRLLMVTGDHPGTAAAVAERAGLAPASAPVLTGAELRATGVPADPAAVPVYARVEPDQKRALVEALRAGGAVVAVTGDGVNDAPALRGADIGVALGVAGTEVAREAADMVVTDDDLATIVTAVREGRGIYDNIRKVVDYLVAGNLSEILVVVACLLAVPSLGIPLLPLQLLWINLLTDGLPALALGVDPPTPGLMRQPPRPPTARLLGARRLRLLAGRGALIAAASVASLFIARDLFGEPLAHARAVMFTVLVVGHLLMAFVARGPDPLAAAPARLGLPARLLGNRWLLAAVGAGVALQAATALWPPARGLFATAGLSAREWALVAAAGIAPLLAMAAVRPRHR